MIMRALASLSVLLAVCPPVTAQTLSIFSNSGLPQRSIDPDTNAVTLGVKFYSTQIGTIKGIRFYRAARSSTGYVAQLYTASGTRLGSVTVSSEPCTTLPCWEELDFASPISISANTTYIAAYFVSGAHYAATNKGLTNGVVNGPLVVPASGAVGGNGVYHYGSSIGFPNQTYQDSNYWVDVAFTPGLQTPTLQLSFNPQSATIPANTALGTTVATVTASWSNGAQFTGTLGFAAPNSNDSGTFALSCIVCATANVMIDPAGPGVSADGGTTQNITVQASQ